MASERVTFPANGHNTDGVLAIPGSGSGPGVLVLQEWWGLVPHIVEVTERFAKAGFTALAPDLYEGETTTSPDEAGKLFMALNIEQTEKALRGAGEFLLRHDACSSATLGVIGFCMGGQLALFAAGANGNIGAVVDFYGVHPSVKPDFAALRAPVLGCFAENDSMVTPDVVGELERTLLENGVTPDFHIYPGADHAFFNDTRGEVYNAEAAQDAWERTLSFFRKHLA